MLNMLKPILLATQCDIFILTARLIINMKLKRLKMFLTIWTTDGLFFFINDSPVWLVDITDAKIQPKAGHETLELESSTRNRPAICNYSLYLFFTGS